MPIHDDIASFEECMVYLKKIGVSYPKFQYIAEWTLADSSGWDEEEFKTLYMSYLKTTQFKIKGKDDGTKLKGDPFEKICRYFLHKGGVVYDISDISVPKQWQVDGQGILNKGNISSSCGLEYSEKFGVQLYLECKNHSKPTDGKEFNHHHTKMTDHNCKVGVMFSTSGYCISDGEGFAEKIYLYAWKGIYHLLFTYISIRSVFIEHKPPLVIFKEALLNAENDQYKKDKELQEKCSKKFCQELATEDYQRFIATNS